MPPHDGDKLNRIEELKSKLFNKNYQTKIGHRDSFPHFQKREVMDSWIKKEDARSTFRENFFMKTSMFKKFFIFSIVFFILALGYASYMFFAKGNTVSNDNIDISVLSNAFTAGGEEYPLLLEIANKNNSPLDLVDLVVEYPKSSQASLSQDNERLRISLGTIPAGGVKNENMKLVLFGEQGSTRQIKISLEYRVEGSNAIFVKDKFYDVSINSTPINLSINAPLEASSNQDITLGVKATLNATKSVSKILLKVDYPVGFQFVKATPAPFLGNNIWNLGDLAPGAERNISIVGKMLDVFDGEEKVFRVWSGSQSLSDKSLIKIVFNSLEHIVMIKKSSIEAKLLINGVYQREYAIDTKTSIQGQIQWTNNLETKINNLEIRAKISGNAVNRATISAGQGFYNSSQDLIIWDKNSQSKFVEINPGDSGAVSFSFSPVSLFSASGGIVSLPSVNIDVFITGQQAQGGGVVTELNNSESKIVRIISDVGLSTKALFFSGPFLNSGPLPPKVEQKTTYSIVWSLSNTANNISKAVIRSTLPPWMHFTGSFSPATEDLTYDASTKEIVWNVSGIPRGTGITEAGRDITFQVQLTPSLSQVGTEPIIINDTILTGHDDFANVNVRVNKASLSTRLLNDLNFPANASRVVQ
ncbi:hypothetical protein A3B84_03040 [Candidatus Nomurabacteria bacterium RIFCSPHIGHO2_02_FULL_35_13]|uniref:DUF11 domain-containing protein n=1 Tax=Candidatus Nomurabacteria bacterium RIFCSPHIGHO2_02_FULL_35_13 TaxID=1801748 RepID=A0A1F6VPM5_9BACT|nr:MAG: hypothetical protein A3B84_03040 [Candidatus Nomurabacteria bacterium RIFCSPHIGHO2_02_FULL_35_13]